MKSIPMLERLQSVLKKDDEQARHIAIHERMEKHERWIQPSISQHNDAVEDFIQRAREHDTEVQRLNKNELVEAIASKAMTFNVAQRLVIEPEKFFDELDFSQTQLETVKKKPGLEDMMGLSLAVAGVAETGTLMMHSGRERMTTLNYVPEHHFVVLFKSAILDSLDDVWKVVRKRKVFPRAVNLITGPSRTADIEQTLYMGAHGPKTQHIFLVDDR